jgi:hypothetical protein
MPTKRTTTSKRYDAARKRRDARNTGKPTGDEWPVIGADNDDGGAEVSLDNGCRLQFLTSPGSDKFDPSVQIKLSKARGAVCVRLSAAAVLDLVEMINEYTDTIFDKAEEFERGPEAVRIPKGRKASGVPAPDDDDLPVPEDDDLEPMPALDRRKEHSMRDWLIVAAPQYAERYPSWDKAKLKRYVDKVISETGRYNQKGERLS